jgi:hypothetical protein
MEEQTKKIMVRQDYLFLVQVNVHQKGQQLPWVQTGQFCLKYRLGWAEKVLNCWKGGWQPDNQIEHGDIE